jgi:aspartate/methionine/tyrosine aminotransferase
MIDQSRRLAAVQTPVIPTVGRWIAAAPGTISLGQGVVSYGPPREALEAAHKFGAAPADHRYGPVEGLPALIAALQDKLARENNVRVGPGTRIVITAGSNMGFMNALLAIADPGDEIILPVPFYFNHEMAVVMANATPVTVPTTPAYQLDLDAIAEAFTPRTRAVVTVSPNNPTGAVYPERDLRVLNALCRDRGAFHIHDEAYEYFTYGDARHFSPGSIEGAGAHTISLFSFSKGYGMASWRVGYMVIPALLWDAVNKIQDTLLVCPTAIAQHAASPPRTSARRIPAGLAPSIACATSPASSAHLPCDAPVSEGAFYFSARARGDGPAGRRSPDRNIGLP